MSLNNEWPFTNAVDPNIYSERKDWPKISIVTPSYNQGQYIEETILSVINQNYPNLEYIIIDGGSTDNTVEIIKKYENKIAYWVSEPDKGQSHAINKGFSKCTGDIIGWINSDDYYLREFLFHAENVFAEKNADIVYANSITLDERSGKIYYEYANFLIDKYLQISGNIMSHTTFWKKNIHQNVDENINCAMDFELWMRLFKGSNYKHLNEFGGVFRLQNNSKSIQGNLSFKDDWQCDITYINQKHNIKINKWLLKIYSLTTRTYKFLCNLKFKKKKFKDSYIDYTSSKKIEV
jgi:glycosyltransferase involved in cell wall biosynthesis